jgi:hypothetical protein
MTRRWEEDLAALDALDAYRAERRRTTGEQTTTTTTTTRNDGSSVGTIGRRVGGDAEAMRGFDERLARVRAQAAAVREDAERIERWLGAGGRGAPGVSLDEARGSVRDSMEFTRGGERRGGAHASPSTLFVAPRSPGSSVRNISVLHRPVPRRPLSASVEGTEWTSVRSGTRGFEFGTAASVVSDEEERKGSAFQSIARSRDSYGNEGDGFTERAERALTGADEGGGRAPEEVSTPPRVHQSPMRPPVARQRYRTKSEDFTRSGRMMRLSIDKSSELRSSMSSHLTPVETVAVEAELERAVRMSEVSGEGSEPVTREDVQAASLDARVSTNDIMWARLKSELEKIDSSNNAH